MGWTVKEWVDQFCSTMDDATSLRVMRGRAIAGAAEEIELLDALEAGDVWVESTIAMRDTFLDCIDKIESRLNELGVEFGSERNYGVKPGMAERVEHEREKRNG